MKELTLHQVEEVGGALTYAELGMGVMALGLAGGPFSGAFGLTVGFGMMFFGGGNEVVWAGGGSGGGLKAPIQR